jgi:hypothetical protein
LLGKAGLRGQSYGMSPSFESLVEEVRTRSIEEKEELRFLLERDLVEERREEILRNHRRSQAELKRGKIKFSSSIQDLKKSLKTE